MTQRGSFIAGILDEASIVITDEGTYMKVTVVLEEGIADDIGERRTICSRKVFMNGRPLSEVQLLAMRGYRVEIRYLPGNTHEIEILDERE